MSRTSPVKRARPAGPANQLRFSYCVKRKRKQEQLFALDYSQRDDLSSILSEILIGASLTALCCDEGLNGVNR